MTPAPETDLQTLLRTLEVTRQEGVWAYDQVSDPVMPAEAVFLFREPEGWTIVRPARPDEPADNRWVWLELSVYSDLHAVGFLAAVAQCLAEAGIPCNAVAARCHDHIFVPEPLADRAVEALRALRNAAH